VATPPETTANATRDRLAPRPLNLIAELTYRCPLRCAYCSNPLDWASTRDGLDTAAWARTFREAAALGVVHVGLTGGEPSVRPDLRELVAAASEAGLFVHLVTAGSPIEAGDLGPLVAAGLRSVQLSIQDAEAEASDAMAGTVCFDRKLAFARAVRLHRLPLTLNVVVHRHNLDRVEAIIGLARSLDAERLELANVQYYGWALRNRAALLPSKTQLDAALARVKAARHASARPEILIAVPDYHRERPKPCMGGWGQRMIVVDPSGRVLPCHAAAGLPGLEFWSVRERPLAACWGDAPGMNAFRGEDWMSEPCRSCPERTRDHGGCRCQAFALLGDAGATDPVCALAPDRSAVLSARKRAEAPVDAPLVHRAVS
jgi:pyrroloquinoline quinone biosynthesis protein E